MTSTRYIISINRATTCRHNKNAFTIIVTYTLLFFNSRWFHQGLHISWLNSLLVLVYLLELKQDSFPYNLEGIGERELMNLLISLFLSFFLFREVLASPLILNVPHKVNWKNCALGKEVETKITLRFRDKFQPFDFTADDDDD